MFENLKPKVFKISQITNLIKDVLEETFGTICLEGEISNFRPSSLGHFYFTLKDEESSISAVMFKHKSKYLDFKPEDGMLVRTTGVITVYKARGNYQINIDKMEVAGIGEILKILEKRKQMFFKEGLFDLDRKKSIPFFPEKVAVITSPTGAAIKDIIKTIERRNPSISVVVLPSPVQGVDAADKLAKQLENANNFNIADVIIIGRGGGSLEDLLPFSEEVVVRAIENSKIPVISAVGHEVDWALSDFVADERAATPTAAAELVSPEKNIILNTVNSIQNEFIEKIDGKLEKIKLLLSTFTWESLEMHFRKIEQPYLLKFDDLKEDLLNLLENKLTKTKHNFALLNQAFLDTNPNIILQRGYSIVIDAKTNKPIKNAKELNENDKLIIKPAKGEIIASVKKIKLV